MPAARSKPPVPPNLRYSSPRFDETTRLRIGRHAFSDRLAPRALLTGRQALLIDRQASSAVGGA